MTPTNVILAVLVMVIVFGQAAITAMVIRYWIRLRSQRANKKCLSCGSSKTKLEQIFLVSYDLQPALCKTCKKCGAIWECLYGANEFESENWVLYKAPLRKSAVRSND